MGEFKVKTSLDLDTSEAKSKMESLGKEKIKAKLDLDTGHLKKAFKDVGKISAKDIAKSNTLRSQAFSKSMDKDLNKYRKMLNNKQRLERAYLKEYDEGKRKSLESQIDASKRAIKSEHDTLMKNARINKDTPKMKSIDALTQNYLGKNAFTNDRSTKEMLNDWSRIGDVARKTRDTFGNIKNDSSRAMVSEAKRRNDDVLKRLSDSNINEENREKLERRALGYKKYAQSAMETDKAEHRFRENLRKERVKAEKIDNTQKRQEAQKGLKQLENSANNLSLNRNPKDVSSSFNDLTNNLRSYSSEVSKIGKEGKKIDTSFNSDLKKITGQGEKVKDTIGKLNSGIAKDIAGKMNIKDEVNSLMNESRAKDRNAGALKDSKRDMDYWDNTSKKLSKIDGLSENVNGKIKNAKKSLSGFADSTVQTKADKIFTNLADSYKKIDKTSPDGAIKDLTKFNKTLGDTKIQAGNLGKIDKMLGMAGNKLSFSPEMLGKFSDTIKNVGFKNLNSSGFENHMRTIGMEMDKVSKTEGLSIRNQKAYQKEIQQTTNKARGLKQGLQKIDGSISGKYKNQYLSGIDKIIESNNSKSISPQILKSNQIKLDNYKEQRKILTDLNTLESSSGKKYSDTTSRISGLASDLARWKGADLQNNLDKSFNRIDTGKLESTHKNMRSFNKELQSTSRSARQLSSFDNAIQKLESFEGVLKPKDVNKFRKGYVDLAKSDLLGTGAFDAQLKRANTQVRTVAKYKTSMDNFKSDFKASVMGSSMGYLLGYGTRSLVTGALGAYKDIDASMINIKKVADNKDVNTVEKIRGITKQAIATAKEVGTSSSDVQNSIATSIQSGMGGMKASMEVARKSMILSNIGDMSQDDATKSINTIVKSFGLDPLKKKTVAVNGLKKETTELAEALDFVNHAGNNYAISEQGVASALQRGGGVLHDYGVSLSDSVAMITAANEPLQDPEKVGNGLRTIAMRLAGVSVKAKDGSVELNNTGKALRDIAGIDVYEDKKTGKIKGMVKILDEVKQKWGSLQDDERMALSESIAGKNRANVFSALMNNYDNFKKMRDEFSKGQHFGSAESENSKYVDSLAGKTNRLKETMTSLMTTMVSSKAVYGVIDGINGMAEGLDKAVQFGDKHKIQLPLIATGVATLRGVYKGLKTEIQSYDDLMFGKSGNGERKLPKFINKLWGGDKEQPTTKPKKKPTTTYTTLEKSSPSNRVLSEKNKELDRSTESTKRLDKANRNFKLMNASIGETDKKRTKNIIDLNKARESSIKSIDKETKSLDRRHKKAPRLNIPNANPTVQPSLFGGLKNTASGLVKGAGGVISGLATGIASSMAGIAGTAVVMFAITKGVQLLAGKYNDLAHGVSNTKKANIESRDALIAENKEIENNLNYVKKNSDSIDSLYRRKKALNKIPKSDRTEEQEKELKGISEMEQRLAKINPNLVTGYDKNGNPIIRANADAKKLSKSLEYANKVKKRLIEDKNNRIYANNVQKMLSGEAIGSGVIGKIKNLNKEVKALNGETGKQLGSNYALSAKMNGGTESTIATKESGMYERLFNSIGGVRSFDSRAEGFRKSYAKWRKDVDAHFSKIGKEIDKYDNASAENAKIQLGKMGNRKDFQELGVAQQEAVMGLGSMFQWGKIKNANGAVDTLMNLTGKVNPDKIEGITEQLGKLKETYMMDRDYDAYSKGIGNVAKSLGELTGKTGSGDIAKFKDYMMDIERGYDSLDQMREINYMRSKNAKPSDLLRDDAQGMYASKVQERYGAIKELQESYMGATNGNERKDILGMVAQDDRFNAGFRKIAKNLSEQKTLSSDASSAFMKLAKGLTEVDMASVEAKRGLSDIERQFDNGMADKAVDFGDGMNLSMKELQALMNAGLTYSDFVNSFADVNKDVFSRVDDFYKGFKDANGESVEIPIDVKMKIAEYNLSEADLKGMENTIKELGIKGENANTFRKDGAKYFEGAGGDWWKAYENMTKTDEGIKFGITNGVGEQMGKLRGVVGELNKEYIGLNDKMKENVKQLDPSAYVSYLNALRNVSKQVKDLNNERADAGKTPFSEKGLAQAEQMFQTGKTSGLNDKQAKKAIQVAVEYTGEDGIERINGLLASLPPETTASVIVAMAGDGGGEISRGIDSLIQGLSQEEAEVVIKAVLKEDGNLEALKGVTDEESAKEIKVKYVKEGEEPEPPKDTESKHTTKSDDSGLDETKEKIDQLDGKTATTTVNTEANGVEEAKENIEGLDGKTSNTTVNTEANGVEEAKQKIDGLDGQTATTQVNADTSGLDGVLGSIESLKGQTIQVPAKIDFASPLDGASVFGMMDNKLNLSVDVDKSNLDNLGTEEKTVKVTLEVDTSALDSLEIADKTVKIKTEIDKSSLADVQLPTKDIKVKITADKSSITNALSGLGKGKTVKVNVQANTTMARTQISTLGMGKIVKVNVTANTSSARSSINGLGRGKTVNVTVKANVSSARNAINGLKNKTITITANVKVNQSGLNGIKAGNVNLKAKDNASAPAKKATSAVNAFPRGTKSVTLRAIDNATTTARRATQAVNSFPTGSRVMSLITKYVTQGSPSGGGGKGTKKSIFPKPEFVEDRISKIRKLQDNLLPKIDIGVAFRRPTQMNPLTSSMSGVASTTGVGGASTSVSVATASPAPILNTYAQILELVEAFKSVDIKGFTYQGVTALSKLHYSAQEIYDAFKHDVDILNETKMAVQRLEGSIGILDTRLQRLRGSKKIAMLNLQDDQIREEQRRLQQERVVNEEMKNYYRHKLNQLGIKFTNNGAITANYAKIMVKLKQEEKQLEEQIAEIKNNEAQRKKLEKQKEENGRKQKIIGEYNKTVDEEVSIDKKVYELDNKLGDNNDEKIKLRISAWKENYDAINKLMDISIQQINRELDTLNIKMKYAFGYDKLSLMNAQVEGYKKMQTQLESNSKALENLKGGLQSQLKMHGFKFEGDDISNYQKQLAILKDTSTVYDDVKGIANDYLDLISTKIPDANKQMEEYSAKIRDVSKQRLEDTKAIEDKITSMYKKQISERIKAMEKESKVKDEQIRKRKEEYNLARKEADYQDAYHKKLQEIEKLEKRRDIYKKDTSQKGQKELQKLNEQIEKEVDDLQKTVGKHVDDKVNKIYDDEIKALDDSTKKEKERLEEEYTDDVLLKKAQESIASGLFVDIDGEVKNLQSALIDYINEFEGGLSATGSIIQGELISKLEVANDTVKNFKETLDSIGTGDYNIGGYIQESKYKEIADRNEVKNEFNYNSPLVLVQGGSGTDVDDKIVKAVEKAMDRHLRELKGNIR